MSIAGRDNEYSICDKCHDIIILRKPGSSVWKLTTSHIYKDKVQHKPILIFQTGYDAKKIQRKARELYWSKWTDEQRPSHNKAWRICVKQAAKDLGYVTKK